MIENKLFKWIGGKKWLAEDLDSIFKEALQNFLINEFIKDKNSNKIIKKFTIISYLCYNYKILRGL